MDTLLNFRDLGGITTKDKTKVFHHQFLRSGELVKLSENDKKKLIDTYKLKRIVDFRSEDELNSSPDDIIEGVFYEHLDILGKNAEQGASLKDLIEVRQGADEVMKNIYKQLVLSETSQKNYSKFLRNFIDYPNQTTIFHCYAGKDRTGFGAALILSSLNVSKKDIYIDYLKTNELRKKENTSIEKELKKKSLSGVEIEQIMEMLSVKKEYLEYSFELIEDNFGSVSNYFTDVLYLSHDFENKMKQLYTY